MEFAMIAVGVFFFGAVFGWYGLDMMLNSPTHQRQDEGLTMFLFGVVMFIFGGLATLTVALA